MATQWYRKGVDGLWRSPGRDPIDGNFTLGVTKPDATNTGCLPGTVFTDVTSDLTITTNDTTFENRRFIGGKVYVKAKRVTFRNCLFLGQQTAGVITDPLVRCHWDVVKDVLFDRCTFGSSAQVGYPDAGILGWNFTAKRCDISRVSDGVRNINPETEYNLGGITVEGCYIHDLMYVTPSSDGADNQTHNDCIQIVGGSDIVLRGNNLSAYVDRSLGKAAQPGIPLLNATDPSGQPVTGDPYAWMTAIAITPDHGDVSAVIDQNWMSGGQFVLNIAKKAHGLVAPGVTVTNNRFAKDNRLGNYDFLVANAVQPLVTHSGNVFPDGSSVPMRNGG